MILIELQPCSEAVWKQKYQYKDETLEENLERVAQKI